MMRPLLLLLPALLAGCISLSSTRSNESPAAPDYAGFCKEKEAQCRDTCGSGGVQAFSCKAAAREGLEYQCQCKKPGGQL